MLGRVAVVQGQEALLEAAAQAAGDRVFQLYAWKRGEPPEPGTTGALATPGCVEDALDIMGALGAWQETVMCLLADALDCREGFLPGSSARVMEHAARFARAVRLEPDDQLTLERGALVRDIGKTKIPNEVLLKDGVLTYDEWCLVQEHPHLGFEIVQGAEVLRDTAAIVRNHHESYDGDGYPDGLEGDAIPYLARIMKILDVYCAMTSPRHYRKGHSTHEEAVEYLRGEQGKHFDPELVEVFIAGHIGQTVPPSA